MNLGLYRRGARRLTAEMMLVAMAASFSVAGHAQQAAPAAPATPSDSAMVNLVRLLTEQGVLSKEKGEALMRQAEAEAAQARAGQASAQNQVAQTQLPPPAAGTVRVPYVPETVRAQIRDELKQEVLAQAKAEGWASQGEAAPEWTRRITLSGDIRVRSQSDLFARDNSNLIFDFARINQLGPIDVINSPVLFFLNSREDRWNQLRLRARLGINATISEGIEAGIQLATGDDNSPISTNVSLGGGLAKRDLWLQKAYFAVSPTPETKLLLGRFDNPFRSSELLFDEDLAFDGIAGSVNAGRLIGSGVDVVLRGGAFPLDFGDPDFPVTSIEKRKFAQAYLFSGQLEVDGNITDAIRLGASAAYHSFTNVQGELSEPCALFAGAIECSTDALAPAFLRKGNTLSPLRQILADPALPPGQIQPQPQLFGLTFDYDILHLGAFAEFPVSDAIGVRIEGDYVRNLGFKRGDICRNGVLGQPFNNGGPDGDGNICSATNPTSFVGGNEGYLGRLTIGHRKVARWGQWSAQFGYRYLQSDAVLDSLTDSDFHLGGTNAKGYVVGGTFGLFDGVTLGAKWLSANEVSGEPFAVDVLQIDLEASF